MPGYINYDFLLTSNWAMEYASYENSSATGYVVGCEDFLLIEGN